MKGLVTRELVIQREQQESQLPMKGIDNQRTSDTERTTGELPMKGLINRELVIQREQQESCQ